MKIQRPKYNWQSYNFGTISLCMIMRNSAKTLHRCLNSVAELVSEIVIVDTGSTDYSINIAKSYGARVLKDPWQDDFARPRNIGLEHARGQWILILDPDETISKKHHADFRWLTRTKPHVAFFLTTFNYGPFSRDARYKRLPEGLDPTGKFPGYTPSNKTRFFKNGLGIRFEGCWHELTAWCIMRKKLSMAQSTIPIHHWTHEYEQTTWQEKREFYLKMGEKKVREWPTSGKAWWELSVAESAKGLNARAVRSITQAIKLGFKGKEQYFSLAQRLKAINQKEKGDYSFEKGICSLFPELTHIDPDKKTLTPLIAC